MINIENTRLSSLKIFLPPVLLIQLLDSDGLVSRGFLLDLVLVVLFTDYLEVDLVLTRDVPLLLQQQSGVPGNIIMLDF